MEPCSCVADQRDRSDNKIYYISAQNKWRNIMYTLIRLLVGTSRFLTTTRLCNYVIRIRNISLSPTFFASLRPRTDQDGLAAWINRLYFFRSRRLAQIIQFSLGVPRTETAYLSCSLRNLAFPVGLLAFFVFRGWLGDLSSYGIYKLSESSWNSHTTEIRTLHIFRSRVSLTCLRRQRFVDDRR